MPGRPKSTRELVAESVQGENPLRLMGIFLQLLAQPGHVNIHGSAGGDATVAPNLAKQGFARDRGSAVLEQVAEELKLLGRERHGLAMALDFGAPHIHADGSELVNVACGG